MLTLTSRRGGVAAANIIVLVFIAGTSAGAALAQDDPGLSPPAVSRTPAHPGAVRTGFDPRIDAPSFANNGDYASDGGDCFGMSLLAVDHYVHRLAASGLDPRRPDLVRARPVPAPEKVARAAAEGDLAEEEAAALAQVAAERKDDGDESPVNRMTRPSSPAPILAALARIAKTGVPELFFIDSRSGDGHATVLFGFEEGKLRFYDPNYPGETVAWPFDPVKGLGRHPKADDAPDFYGRIAEVSSVPFARLEASRDVGAIRALCSAQAPACTGKFPATHASVAAGADERHVVVSGKVGRGLPVVGGETTERPAKVWLRVGGKVQRMPVRLKRDGSFRAELNVAAPGPGRIEVQVVATTEDGALAGYASLSFTRPARTGIAEALDRR